MFPMAPAEESPPHCEVTSMVMRARGVKANADSRILITKVGIRQADERSSGNRMS
jgi:hypothetical protein